MHTEHLVDTLPTRTKQLRLVFKLRRVTRARLLGVLVALELPFAIIQIVFNVDVRATKYRQELDRSLLRQVVTIP